MVAYWPRRPIIPWLKLGSKIGVPFFPPHILSFFSLSCPPVPSFLPDRVSEVQLRQRGQSWGGLETSVPHAAGSRGGAFCA